MFKERVQQQWLGNVKKDIFGGLVTSVTLIPEVIGFAIIAGIHPMLALFASVISLLVTSFAGGRPAMVTAAAGSMAVVMAPLIKDHGIPYMVAATLLTGVIQILLGFAGVHKLMRFVSPCVLAGFVNGLAIIIFMSQAGQLPGLPVLELAIVAGTVFLMVVLPRLIKSVPPALICIVIGTLLSALSGLDLKTVGHLGDMSGSLPLPQLPAVPFNWTTFYIIAPVAVALSVVGLAETLVTLPLIDDLTDSQGDQPREVKGQGLANLVSGVFGCQAGCAMIGQAVMNVKSGGRKRFSTLTAGLVLLLMIVALKDVVLNHIPTAALIGIMIIVAFETFNWQSVRKIKGGPVTESITMVVTTAVTAITSNLAIGIVVGIALDKFLTFAAGRLRQKPR